MGFTLIELMIGVVILAILLVLAAPSFRDTIDKRRITNAGVALKDQIQQARSLSVLMNRPMTLEFKFTSATQWCFGITDRPSCNCSETSLGPNDAGSCSYANTASIAAIDGAERIVVIADSASYAGVSLDEADPAKANERIVFEPTRGVRTDGRGLVNYNFSSTQSTRKLRVSANVIGRTSMCSTTEALLGGIPKC